MVIHLGALVDDPPQASAAVTHNCPVVKVGGKVTCTLVDPCPPVTGVCDPDKVHVYNVAPVDAPQVYDFTSFGHATGFAGAIAPGPLTVPLIDKQRFAVLPQAFTPCTHT